MQHRYTLYNIVTVMLCMITMVVVSCTTNTVFDSYAHTPLSGWEKNDTLTFNISPLVVDGAYCESVGVRMTNTFPFTSISLIVEQHVYPKGSVLTDTIKCQITDQRGNFLGSGVSSYQYSFPLRELILSKGDSIHISVRHNMKREILPGVSDVGLKIDLK